MSKDLIRIRSSLLDTPHLIDEQTYRAIQSYFEDRATGVAEAKDGEDFGNRESYVYNSDTKTAIIKIEGPLTNRSTPIQALCGGASYNKLKADFSELIASGAKTIAMEIRSGGGEAVGCFSSAKFVRKLATDNGVRLLAYTDDRACSAAYAWASIADEFIVAEDSTIGSIGVLVQISNDLKKKNQEGIETIFVTAGKSKTPFNKDGSFSEEALEDIQSKVDKTYASFVKHVVTMRNISEEAVKATEAKTFMGDDAVALGLADKVMTQEEFYEYLADVAQGSAKEVAKMIGSTSYKLTPEETLEMEELQKLQAALDAKDVEMSALATQFSELTAQMESLQATLGEKEAALSEALVKARASEEQAALQAKEAKLKDRQAALFAAGLSEEDAKSQAASLEALDDATFETVRAGFAKQSATVQGSDLFQQQSATATEAVVEKTKTAAEAAVEATRKAMKDRGI